jgi:hypothetical protein
VKFDILDKLAVLLVLITMAFFFVRIITPLDKKEPITIDLKIIKEYPDGSNNDRSR